MALRLVSRKAWGAERPRRVDRLGEDAVTTIVVHYTGMNPDEQAAHRGCAARVRGVQRYHKRDRGWNDIAYNFLVCKHGYIFRGRGNKVRSAATRAANGFSISVCFLGDDTQERDDVTDEGRAAIERCIAHVRVHHPRAAEVRPHSDFGRTECPGDELRRFVRGLS